MSVSNIFGVFAKSPIKPLEEHIGKSTEAAKLLTPFFEAAIKGNWSEAEKIRNDISALEKEADAIKRQLRLNLPRGIFMPVERTDMLDLLTQQDRIANKAKDIAGRVIGRQCAIPAEIEEEFLHYVKRSVDAAKQAKKVINELDELLEAGFSGREVDIVDGMIAKLDNIEDDTDSLQISIRRKLMAVEDNYKPLDMMFLYQVVELVGDLADQCERVGARLEIMLSRS